MKLLSFHMTHEDSRTNPFWGGCSCEARWLTVGTGSHVRGGQAAKRANE